MIVFHYFPKRVLSDLVYQLRYESPYGQSSRCSVLDRLARFDLALESQDVEVASRRLPHT